MKEKLTMSQTKALVFTCLQYKAFENIVGKGEIARNERFLLFPQCFKPYLRKEKSLCWLISFCRLQMPSTWTSLEFCRLVKS